MSDEIQNSSTKKAEKDEELQWVTFKLENEVYGINVMQVQEILRYSEIAPVPGAPLYVLGIINLRGNVVTVIDTRARFGLEPCDVTDNTRVVVIESESQVIGILVDSASEVVYLKASEIDDLLKMDVGIMPLKNDKWANGKCGFKALQYMALGIPAIVSPVGVNTEIVDHDKNGWICNSEQEWREIFLQILSDKSQLQNYSKAARAKIESRYSVKSNTANFLHLFAND